MKPAILTAIVFCATALPAAAASPEAWDEFRETMEKECRALAEAEIDNVAIRVDPFGSENFGLALVSGLAGETPVERICVMDKQTRAVELGGELAPGSASDEPLSFVDPADIADLQTMEEAARTTLSQLKGSGETLDPAAMDVANAVLASLGVGSAEGFGPGAYDCTVYWYGFLDQGARRVGSHQCRIEETEAGVTVEKISGERLAATLVPTDDGLVYVGRTYLPGHDETAYDADPPVNAENPNFGNKVGLAASGDGMLYLLSTQARGMRPEDATFFEIIALERAG